MSTPTPRDHAGRGPVRRPSTRTHYPDLSRQPGQGPARIIHDPASGQRLTVRFRPILFGDRAHRRFSVKAAGEPACTVADFGDYHQCDCSQFRRDWECPHTRALIDAGLIVEARFALTAETVGGKGGHHGR